MLILVGTGSGLLNDGLLNQFHFALRTGTPLLRGYVLGHGADIVELRGLFRVSRTFLLYCSDDAHRVHLRTDQKQCNCEERQKSEKAHFLPLDRKRLPAQVSLP